MDPAVKEAALVRSSIFCYEDDMDTMDYQYYQTVNKGPIGSEITKSSPRMIIQVKMK